MVKFTKKHMLDYLGKSMSSINDNKLNGLLAEISFRETLAEWGFSDRVSPGGWIARNVGPPNFGTHTVVLFPDTVKEKCQHIDGAITTAPNWGLHTICSTFHQIGIKGYWCVPTEYALNNQGLPEISWQAVQLGVPAQQEFDTFKNQFDSFTPRKKRHGFLRYKNDARRIPKDWVAEEFSKEHLRVSFQSMFMSEMVDVDGFFWGQQHTYPIEIKEKTAANDNRLGDFFGLDVGPLVKLAFYAAKRGTLHSLFVVREINNTTDRELISWWAIRFEDIARFASWIPISGGKNMNGGKSTVVMIPKDRFTQLTSTFLASL